MKRIPIPSLITAALLVLILVIYSVTFQVRFNEVAVRVSLWDRQNARLVSDPGLYLKWPAPIETVRKYDTRLRTLETPETEIKTRDKQNLIVGCYVVWRVTDPLRFYVRVPLEREAENKLRERINEKRAAVIGSHDLAEFVNLDRELVNRGYDQIEQELLAAAAGELLRDYGVALLQVGVRRISLPEEATQTVLESMKQERERLAAQYRQEGTALKEAITARAESAKKQILAFANRKAEEIQTAGVKASERIFEQVRGEDEEFFLWLRALEALEAGLKERATVFLDWSELTRQFVEPPLELIGPPAGATAESPP